MLAEVEFADEALAARFQPPPWFGREVDEWHFTTHLP
jgi:CYTH domain-containing protein